MFKLFKAKNAADWKTTVLSIIGGILMIAGILYPDKIDSETGEAIKVATDEILTGGGALFTILVGIFGAKDGDKE